MSKILTLIKAQVFKYKSIDDSTPVELNNQVTVLVGKNESGKTAFLEALHKSMPLNSVEYDYVADYPRKEFTRYRQQHESENYQKVVELTFEIEKSLADKINNNIFGGTEIVNPGTTFIRTFMQKSGTLLCKHTSGYGVFFSSVEEFDIICIMRN